MTIVIILLGIDQKQTMQVRNEQLIWYVYGNLCFQLVNNTLYVQLAFRITEKHPTELMEGTRKTIKKGDCGKKLP